MTIWFKRIKEFSIILGRQDPNSLLILCNKYSVDIHLEGKNYAKELLVLVLKAFLDITPISFQLCFWPSPLRISLHVPQLSISMHWWFSYLAGFSLLSSLWFLSLNAITTDFMLSLVYGSNLPWRIFWFFLSYGWDWFFYCISDVLWRQKTRRGISFSPSQLLCTRKLIQFLLSQLDWNCNSQMGKNLSSPIME